MYEITFILKEENAAAVRDALQKNLADISAEEPFKKIKFAYPISKESYGFLGSFKFEAPPEAIEKISAALRQSGGVLRFLIGEAIERTAASGEARPFLARIPAGKKEAVKDGERGAQTVLTNEELEKKIEEILQ